MIRTLMCGIGYGYSPAYWLQLRDARYAAETITLILSKSRKAISVSDQVALATHARID